MRFLLPVFAIAALILPPPLAHAEGAHDYVWHLYHGDDPAASLAVVERTEVDSEEPYWPFLMQCSFDEPWTMTVAEVDERTLGATIASGNAAEFSLVVDGEEGDGGLGSYFPELSFSQMFGEWEYSIEWDIETLKSMAAAKTLTVKGTGVDLPLPEAGMSEAFAEFEPLCAGYAKMGIEAAPDDSDDAEPEGAKVAP